MKIRTSRHLPEGAARIVAFDPGGTTGVCVANLFQNGPKTWDVEFEFYELAYPDDMDKAAWLMEGADTIIIENWNLFPGTHLQKGAMTGPEAKGFIYATAQIKGLADRVVLQQPGVQNKCFRKFVKEHVGDYWPKSDHCRSALCHLIYYLKGGAHDKANR